MWTFASMSCAFVCVHMCEREQVVVYVGQRLNKVVSVCTADTAFILECSS